MTAKLTPAARKARHSLMVSRLAFGAGVVVSMGANVIASDHTPVGVGIGLWVPTAFLLSMAMVENVSVKGRWGIARKVAIGFVALVAGWVSYWHIVDVALMGGADTITAHLLPLTVDVMMALASPGIKKKVTATTRKAPVKKATVTPIRKSKTA